jgi:hypothetical protein
MILFAPASVKDSNFFHDDLCMSLITRLFSLSGLVFMLSSCSTSSLDHYAQNQPRLDPQEFFTGDLVAHGVVKNRSGEVTRYFTAGIKAWWTNGVGTLEERFEFNDGEIQYRTWTLTPTANGFDATAGDVTGVGKGATSGNAMKLDYVLEINYKGSPLALAVEDWMWLVDENTLLNESTLRKWGFKVGSVQLVISRNPDGS